jgi:arylsulfatase A-like enzyme
MPEGLNRREFIRAAACAGLAAGAVQVFPRLARAEEAPRKPNLLFVFSDQHRAASLGCYGETEICTPHFDAFAKEGLRLDAAISNTPVCVPYRGSLLTGLYSSTFGVTGNELEKNFKPDREKTLARTFKRAGYACGYIGKWHLPGTPGSLGFEDYWAFNHAEHSYFKWTYETGPDDPQKVTDSGFFRPRMEADLAIKFMRQQQDSPFCLFLSWGPPHTPYNQCPRKYNHYKHLERRPNVPNNMREKDYRYYHGLIEGVDVEFGRLLKELDNLGLANDTIVVYTSDHGDMMGSQGLMGKCQPYRESLEVPFLIRYPNHIPAGSSSDAMLAAPDVFPTLAALAGLPAPAGLDGQDYSPLLLGRAGAKRRQYSYLTIAEVERKMVWRGIRTGRYVYARDARGPWVLFDHQEDPFEMENLVQDRPKLLKELDDWTLQLMAEHHNPFPAAHKQSAATEKDGEDLKTEDE